MSQEIVLFGCGKIGEVLLYYFQHQSDFEVVAVTVDRDYLPGERWNDLPTVAFDEVERRYPPSEYQMFVALGYQQMNALRAGKVDEAKAKGYTLVSYIHPDAGLPRDCTYGENTFVMNHVMIHPCVKLGRNNFIWSGTIIGHHGSVGDHCWLTSGAEIAGAVQVGDYCFFAINSTVADQLTVGDRCFIGASALVTKSTQPGEVYIQEPTDKIRLNVDQFLKISAFGNI